MNYLPAILLALFIINLGTAFGAGLYETRIVLPRWFVKQRQSGYTVNTTAMDELDSGQKFWSFVTTIPLILLTLANLYVAWSWQLPGRDWWLAAVCITLLERIGTFFFFIPTIIRLSKPEQLSPAHLNRLVSTWLSLNYVRNLLTLLAWVAALMAFGLAI